jgi:hypothetical protein
MLHSLSLPHLFETRYEPRYRGVVQRRTGVNTPGPSISLWRIYSSSIAASAGLVRSCLAVVADLGIALIGLRKAWRDSADCSSLP